MDLSGTPTATISVVGTLPSFLTFHDNGNGTASLSANATAGGSTTVRLTTTNGNGTPATLTLTVTAYQSPTLSVSGNTTFLVNQANTVTFKASGGSPLATAFSYSGTLPTGVTFTDNRNGTATLSGVPRPARSAVIRASPLLPIMARRALRLADLHDGRTDGQPGSHVQQSGDGWVADPPGRQHQRDDSRHAHGDDPRRRHAPVVPDVPGQRQRHRHPYRGSSDHCRQLLGQAQRQQRLRETATQTLTVVVCQPPTLSVSGNTTFLVNQANTVTFKASGGSPLATAFSYSGTLPTGVIFTDNRNGTATLSGAAKAGTVGSYPGITITANNGPTGTSVSPSSTTVALTVNQAATFSSPATAGLLIHQAGSINVTTAGTPTATIRVVGTLPSFLTFQDNGNGTATLTATAVDVASSYPVKLSASNGFGAVAAQTLTWSSASRHRSASAAAPRSSRASPTRSRSRPLAVRLSLACSAIVAPCPPA